MILRNCRQKKKLAVILGTEGEGLAAGTIAGCDYTVRIPMAHQVDSLNVAAASAVAFWELGKEQNKMQQVSQIQEKLYKKKHCTDTQ